VNVTLATVISNDNHDNGDELTLSVTINNEEIDYTNYKFLETGDYEIIYKLTDKSGNYTTVTQNLTVLDTTAPTLAPDTITTYTIGINKKLSFDLPRFIDSDPNNSEYGYYMIEIYDSKNNKLDDTSSIYPIQVDDKVTMIFANSFELGNYQVKFYASDNSNNVTIANYVITLVDDEKPTITVTINNREIENNGSYTFAWGSNLNIVASASDNYQGDLTSKVSKKITYNGNKVNSIDTSRSGQYQVEFKVSDDSNNETTLIANIEIVKDTEAPVINSVSINGKELLTNGTTKINDNYLQFEVDATDNSNDVDVSIQIDSNFTIRPNQMFSISSDLSGKSYSIIVQAKDASDNITTNSYYILVDNTLPTITGVQNGNIYVESLIISAYDENISSITIYKNNKVSSVSNVDINELEISDEGVYKIVARDSYGNVATSVFSISSDDYLNIMNDDMVANKYYYSFASLIETTVDDNKLTFNLPTNNNISIRDRIYILVKYPNSDYKYVAYSMNGETYLSNSTITIDESIIENEDNVNLLENVDDKYYSYLMVIKDSNSGTSDSNKESTSKTTETLRYIGFGVLVVFCVGTLLALIIKLRRRVRAV
jgi:hypothetical protein